MSNRVVILGGSYAALAAAHKILKHTLPAVPDLHLTIVSNSSSVYWNLAAPRSMLPDAIPDSDLFVDLAAGFKKYSSKNFAAIEGTAKSLDTTTKTVTIAPASTPKTTQSIPYDILILATGSSPSIGLPIKPLGAHASTVAALHSIQKRIASASEIVVVGGGYTSIETAGELGSAYSSKGTKKVTLISGTSTLLPTVSSDVGRDALKELKKLNVNVELDTRVTNTTPTTKEGSDGLGPAKVTLSNGKEIHADVYLPATGLTANSEYVPATYKAENGDVNVDRFLRVIGANQAVTPGVFAVGDISGRQPKEVKNAEWQGVHVAQNINVLLRGKSDIADAAGAGLIEYKGDQTPVLAATVGRDRGVGKMGNWRLPSLGIWFVKGRTMMVEKLEPLVMGVSFPMTGKV